MRAFGRSMAANAWLAEMRRFCQQQQVRSDGEGGAYQAIFWPFIRGMMRSDRQTECLVSDSNARLRAALCASGLAG
jgi:hypothetical protein